jgi:hypothetical protein
VFIDYLFQFQLLLDSNKKKLLYQIFKVKSTEEIQQLFKLNKIRQLGNLLSHVEESSKQAPIILLFLLLLLKYQIKQQVKFQIKAKKYK